MVQENGLLARTCQAQVQACLTGFFCVCGYSAQERWDVVVEYMGPAHTEADKGRGVSEKEE